MYQFFKTIKKKRNKRRLGVLWIFLVVMEMFCPVICNDEAFAANHESPAAEVRVSKDKAAELDKITAMSPADQDPDHPQTFCTGDCLCHGMGVICLPLSIQETGSTRTERIDFSFSNPLFSSLPPPHRPPKRA